MHILSRAHIESNLPYVDASCSGPGDIEAILTMESVIAGVAAATGLDSAIVRERNFWTVPAGRTWALRGYHDHTVSHSICGGHLSINCM
jgi:hypothetical protein